MRAQLAAAVFPLAVLVLGSLAAGAPPESAPPADVAGAFRPAAGEARPFPTVLIDPYDDRQIDAGASTVIGRRFAWEPINWRVNSDATTEVQNEEQVAINPLDPDNLVAVWRDFRLGYRRVGVGYSFDGGISWADFLMEEPHYPRQSDPGITVDRLGNFYMIVLSYTGNTSESNGLYVQKSVDGGVTWGGSVPVVAGVPNVFEDKELIACDRTGGAHDGNLYVTWARFGYNTEIMSARSTDGGLGFHSAVSVSDDDGVQWPVPVVGPDGTYYVAWVQYWPSEIRIDRSFDGGATFGSDITVAGVWTPQTDLNGGILVFSFPAMDCDITGGAYDGRLYIAYMDRVSSDFDIFLTRSDDHGATWSSPIRINDDSLGNGRDQFHPWLCVSDDGVVNVAFYDRRNDPSNLLMDLYVAQSFDGGASFAPNRRVTTVSSDPTAGSVRAGLIGEYIGLAALSSGHLHSVWTDTREGNQDVYTSIVDTTFAGAPEGEPTATLALAPPTPNPTRGSARLAYAAPGSGRVSVRILDVTGRLVRGVEGVPGAGGTGSITWDGLDGTGCPAASGVYFVEMRGDAPRAAAIAKIVLLR